MHREPNPKAQASILRQVFAENGVNMVHRQALDVVARLHGHADWHVMSNVSAPAQVEATKPAPAPAAKPAKTVSVSNPSPRRARSLETGLLKCFCFDGIAYVATRAQMNELDNISYKCTPALWAAVEKEAQAHGFTCVGSISVAEDEEQGDTDIKVFVSVELYGRSALLENDSAPVSLVEILDRLSEGACTTADGRVLAEPEDWEVLSVDDHLDTVPDKRRSYVFEAVGFVGNREELKALPTTAIVQQEVWAQVKEQLAGFGFDMVGNMDLCEDDYNYDFNIKVYQCIRLQGRSYLTENMPLPIELVQALNLLTAPLNRLPGGKKVSFLAWQLSAIESVQDPMMMYP